MTEKEKKALKPAIKFASSMRGQYIISQALAIAIESMRTVDDDFQEMSNMKDMEYLFDTVFDIFKIQLCDDCEDKFSYIKMYKEKVKAQIEKRQAEAEEHLREEGANNGNE